MIGSKVKQEALIKPQVQGMRFTLIELMRSIYEMKWYFQKKETTSS